MEGVAFALRESVDLMDALDVGCVDAIAVGGGAKSMGWLQILSDALNLPLRTVGSGEGAPLGAAMLAASGVGYFQSPKIAGENWLHNELNIYPDHLISEQYDAAYMRYKKMYFALRETFVDNSD
tara:strand:- start:6955 stop:7326 length:372 start_codon:yes stop_codon:yes gene_type:complete